LHPSKLGLYHLSFDPHHFQSPPNLFKLLHLGCIVIHRDSVMSKSIITKFGFALICSFKGKVFPVPILDIGLSLSNMCLNSYCRGLPLYLILIIEVFLLICGKTGLQTRKLPIKKI
jgi:hypothetical protein